MIQRYHLTETLDCKENKGDNTSLVAALLFILSSAIGGCGGAIYGVLGPVYIDDNVKKSKAPMLLCITHFVHLLSSAIGYSLASYCLKFFVDPRLHPKITDEDPRFIGAWWIGYVIFAISMFTLGPIICTFPKILPRAALRKKQEMIKNLKNSKRKIEENTKTSLRGLCLGF